MTENSVNQLSRAQLVRAWYPLWISWLAMALEFPLISAFVSRLEHPEIHLAAFGGIVFPISFLIEAPIIPLLSASTALSRDYASYRKLFRIMMWMGVVLTSLHALVAFTPLYDFIVLKILGCPQEIIEPGRVGLGVLLIWTWAIAYRRFHQGVLIRLNSTRLVGIGTLIRLSFNTIVGLISWYVIDMPGILVASIGVMSGVFFESLFIGVVTHAVIKKNLMDQPPVSPPLTTKQFLRFFVPLTLTSILDFLINPIVSGSISRMPRAIESLAILSPLQGISFVLRSPGYALTEIVISSIDRPQAKPLLTKFAQIISVACVTMTLVLLFTPLQTLCFTYLLGYSPILKDLALQGLIWMVPAIFLASHRSLYQGILVHAHKTRAITIGTICYGLIVAVVLGIGVYQQIANGIVFMAISMSIATLAQVAWMRIASSKMPANYRAS